MAVPAIELRDLAFGWRAAEPLLSIPEFSVARGERVLLHGPSGSGKSTLLGLVGGVTRPDRGVIRLLGEDLTAMPESRRDAFRAEHVGFIFQLFNLVRIVSLFYIGIHFPKLFEDWHTVVWQVLVILFGFVLYS